MITLGIETSSPRGSVALLDGDRVLAQQHHEQPNAHAERMMALVEAVFAQAGLSKRQLGRIAVGVGPGSFTGLRVGLALAQGLSVGLDVPLVGVSSLAVLAHGAKRAWQAHAPRNAPPPWFVPLLDARRAEAFVAAYDVDDRERIAPARLPIARVESLVAELGGGHELQWCGHAPALLGRRATFAPEHPQAEDAARLGRTATLAPEVTLQYLRDADATLPCLPPNPLPAKGPTSPA